MIRLPTAWAMFLRRLIAGRARDAADTARLSRTRACAGFLVAMVMPCVVAGTLIFALESPDEGLLAFMAWLLFSVAVGIEVSLPATLVLGLPLFWLYRRFGWNRWWQYFFGGALAGLAMGLIFFSAEGAVAGVFGGIAALSLWFVLFASRRASSAAASAVIVGLLAIGLFR